MLRVANGASNNMEAEGLLLYRDWLPANGEETREYPIYGKRWLSFFPDVPVH